VAVTGRPHDLRAGHFAKTHSVAQWREQQRNATHPVPQRTGSDVHAVARDTRLLGGAAERGN
jgi:hypothetical protein